MSPPLIGIPCSTTARSTAGNDVTVHYAHAAYSRAIASAGGLPVLIPADLPSAFVREVAARLDGLLIAGGSDVEPCHYGETPLDGLLRAEPERDSLDLVLLDVALSRDIPVLGVCRGQQILNVAMGGTLYQDLPLQLGILSHEPGGPRNFGAHDVVVEPSSRLCAMLGGVTRLRSNSIHHQAVKDVGGGLAVAARADDGIVEALEAPDRDFVVSVQFHPEELAPEHEPSQRLFRAFVQAASAHQPVIAMPRS